MQMPLSEEALACRENWERCAPNAFRQPDEEVLAMIAEIRTYRSAEKAETDRVRCEAGGRLPLDHLPEGSH